MKLIPGLEIQSRQDQNTLKTPCQDVWILLDLESASLKSFSGNVDLPIGKPIRWRFRSRRMDGSIGPLPLGWVPMVTFRSQKLLDSAFGPFASFLQVAYETPEGVAMDLIGEWHGEKQTSSCSFSYFAMLHRGLGFGSDKTFSFLSSSRLTLRLKPPAGDVYQRPLPPDRHLVDLTVSHNICDPDRLRISPQEPIIVFTDSTVRWFFHAQDPKIYPMILFYHFEEKDPRKPPLLEEVQENQHFEPCRKMRIDHQGVIAWDFKEGLRRHCFYEATFLNLRNLSLQFLSTGDPQLDNEGIPFPPGARFHADTLPGITTHLSPCLD